MLNPYQDVTWETALKTVSVSHAHAKTNKHFDRLYNGGVRHFAISNYYPSKPVYDDGKGNVENSEIYEAFENWRAAHPDVIPCPNAEHTHHLEIDRIHLNGLGSLWSSGEPIGAEGQIGVEESWKYSVDHILSNLLYADGGGVTINHPLWSYLPLKMAAEMLDYDERVLGIEFSNDAQEQYHGQSYGWDMEYWDALLLSGRRAWGFAVPDWQHTTTEDWHGRIILLTDEATEHAYLKAYRDGHFYSQYGNTNLAFSDINVADGVLTVSADNATSIKIIIDSVTHHFDGASASVQIPDKYIYIRAEAHSDTDSIYSNPIMSGLQPADNGRTRRWMMMGC